MSRLGPAQRRSKSASAEEHSSPTPLPADGAEAHRAKLLSTHRPKRPACAPHEGEEQARGDTRLGSRRGGRLDRELLETLIVREWTKTLKGPYDWGDWPLARYTLGPDFLDATRRHSGLPASGLAWACAMIACGRAPRLRSLDPQPRLAADGRQCVRPDGAAGWSCNLRRGASEGPQLYYWIQPSGRIEFETIGARELAWRE